jgi:glycosyltransferase involved in cell wall biosynthesis
MKILYDYQCFVNDRFGGISKYFYNLYKGLSVEDGIEVDLSVIVSNNIYLKDIPNLPYIQFIPSLKFKGQRKILRELNKVYSKYLLKHKYDLFHPTYYDTYFLNRLNGKPYVLTIYDMIHEIFELDEYFNGYSMLDLKRELAQKAKKVIAISESTKNDIIKYLKISEDKIQVIHLGVKTENTQYQKDLVSLPSQYILFVGRRDKYKNFIFFIKSIRDVLLDNTDLILVCAGGGPIGKKESIIIEELKIKNKILNYDYVNEDSLNYLYQNAVLFVFPSLYEGFGLPVLEAFCNNCPVILSDQSSLPEVGGDAAIYFDPKNEKSIRNTLDKLLGDKILQSKLVEKGNKRIKNFTWDKTCKSTKEVYYSCL